MTHDPRNLADALGTSAGGDVPLNDGASVSKDKKGGKGGKKGC